MVLVNFQFHGVLIVWMVVRQGLIVRAVGAGNGSFSLSLGDCPIRMKYFFKGSLNSK